MYIICVLYDMYFDQECSAKRDHHLCESKCLHSKNGHPQEAWGEEFPLTNNESCDKWKKQATGLVKLNSIQLVNLRVLLEVDLFGGYTQLKSMHCGMTGFRFLKIYPPNGDPVSQLKEVRQACRGGLGLFRGKAEVSDANSTLQVT